MTDSLEEAVDFQCAFFAGLVVDHFSALQCAHESADFAEQFFSVGVPEDLDVRGVHHAVLHCF